MKEFLKAHKKLVAGFIIAVLTAIITLINGFVACTSSGQWNATFKKHYPNPEYNYNLPTQNVNEQGGIEQ